MFEKKGTTGYFSVTYTTSVGMMKCVPQVCYKLADDLRATVEEMAKDGLAKIYPKEVRFISGVPIPVMKITHFRVVESPSEAGYTSEAKHGKGRGRRSGGKEFE
jgi:hypothetical protein